MKNKNIMILALIIIGIIALIIFSMRNANNIGPLGSEHSHAEFKVYINNEMIDFSIAKYMVRDKFVHVEDFNGIVIHKHAIGVTLGYFFDTLGFEFGNECFVSDTGEEFCNNQEKTLKFYVNGKINQDYGNHEIREGEKYLISYGDESDEEIQKQLNLIKGVD